jgi:predicted HicB family RNase H-like nuclease
MAEHFTYRVSWSEEDREHVGTCLEFPSLSHLADDPVDALRGIRELVADVVADMQANAEPVPQALADAHYSGKFVARIPPELHRRLALEAAQDKISLNRLVSLRLSLPDKVATIVRAYGPTKGSGSSLVSMKRLGKRKVGASATPKKQEIA